MGEQALKEFEIQTGLRTPETAGVTDTEKHLGPAVEKAAAVQTQT